MSMCLNKSWRCSRDRFLCTSLPVGEIRKDPGLAGGKSVPVRMSSGRGAGEERRTEHETESTYLANARECEGLPCPISKLQTPAGETNTHSVVRAGFTHISRGNGSNNKHATKHCLCVIMYTFLPCL